MQVAMPLTEITTSGRMPAAGGAFISFYAVPQNSRKNLRAKTIRCLFGRTSSFSGETISKSLKNMREIKIISQEIELNSQEMKLYLSRDENKLLRDEIKLLRDENYLLRDED